VLASMVLTQRRRAYRLLAEEEDRDEDGDGIPDVYQSDATSTGEERPATPRVSKAPTQEDR